MPPLPALGPQATTERPSLRAEVYQSRKNKRWYWRMIAANGEVVASCSGGKQRGYADRDGADAALLLVGLNAEDAAHACLNARFDERRRKPVAVAFDEPV